MYGMCHQRHRRTYHDDEDLRDDVAGGRTKVASPPTDPTQRATDADRERTAALLSQAFRDGALRVEEFDQRLSQTYTADIRGDLDALTSDLPQGWLNTVHAEEDASRRAERHRRRWHREARVYVKAMALLAGIWLLTAVASGRPSGELPYFWPIWPMLGWGIPLLISRPRGPLARTGRRAHTARHS